MRILPAMLLITALLTGCAQPTKIQEGDDMSKRQMEPIESSDALITFDLRNLSAADMKLGKDIRGQGELTVERRRDEAGSHSLVSLAPGPSAPSWFGTFVTLPQVDLPHGAEWIELDAWNPGIPLRLIVDARDAQRDCFEMGFCPNDTVWTGWKTFRIPVSVGADPGDGAVAVRPPLRLKWMIVIMRQGKPWRLGLRELRIKPRATTNN